MLCIVHFCSSDDILSLGQASHGFRRICADPYLRRIGIIKVSRSSTQVRLGGQPVSPSAVSFLRDLRITAPKISLICDLFHASAYSSDIVQFLKNHFIQALEMLFVNDEEDVLADLSFATIFRSILAAVTPTCKQMSFAACIGQSFRTLSCHTKLNPLLETNRHLGSKFQLTGTVTELCLSSSFFLHRALRGTLSSFLRGSAIEIVSLDCDTSEDSNEILRSMTLPSLQMLSIITRDHTLALFPTSFATHHPKLKRLSLLNLRSWDNPDSLRLPSVHLSLPTLSHLTVSSNYASFEMQDVAGLSRLDVISFMTLPVPENRGYCEVVEALTRALKSSTCSRRFSASLTISFTFPRLLDAHIRFCKENPVYRCSCSPLSLKGHRVNARNIEVCIDVLSGASMVEPSLFHSPP